MGGENIEGNSQNKQKKKDWMLLAGSGKWEVEGEAEKKYTSKELGYKLFLEWMASKLDPYQRKHTNIQAYKHSTNHKKKITFI